MEYKQRSTRNNNAINAYIISSFKLITESLYEYHLTIKIRIATTITTKHALFCHGKQSAYANHKVSTVNNKQLKINQ